MWLKAQNEMAGLWPHAAMGPVERMVRPRFDRPPHPSTTTYDFVYSKRVVLVVEYCMSIDTAVSVPSAAILYRLCCV
jgi:hypothetical protein